MQALVIGATGQVGKELMRQLTLRGAEAAGTYRSRPSPGLSPLDITDTRAVAALVARVQPTVVFLPAALTAVDYCEMHRDEAWQINMAAPAAVAQTAAVAGAKLVFYSTEYVFDGQHGPYGEDDAIHPLGVYAESKAAGEQAVQESIADHLIIRTTVVYGWDRGSKNFAMQVWERLSAGEPMRVPADQVGNPTLVDFLVEATLALVTRDVRGLVNVVGRDRVPRTEFALRLARSFRFVERLIEPVRSSALQQLAPRPLDAGLRTEKLEQILGRPAIGLTDAIERLLARQAQDGGISVRE
jgi:dTDP-4-dehydrorhamnose reductase